MARLTREPAEPAQIPHEWRESELTERPSRPTWMDPEPEPDHEPEPAPKGGKAK